MLLAELKKQILMPPVKRLDLHDAQLEVKRKAKRFNVLACGRRWGKTVLGIDLIVEAALRGGSCAWFAPNYKYLDEVFVAIRQTFADAGLVVHSDASKRVIRLSNNAVIDFWTLDDIDAGRGRAYVLVVIDEAAMVPGLKSVFDKAISPTLTDKKGVAWFLSTPRGQGDYYALYNTQSDHWASFTAPSSTNPFIPTSEIERAKAEIPTTVFRQEYLAEFLMPSGAVYDCFEANRNMCKPFKIPEHWPLYIGWDFGSANTAAVVLSLDPEHPQKLYLVWSYFGSGEEPSLHINRVRQAIKRIETGAVGGSSSEDAIRSLFRDAGMYVRRPTVTGPSSVEAGILIVWKAFKTGNLVVFESEVELVREICTYAYKVDTVADKITDMIDGKSTFHRLDAMRYGVSELADIALVGEPTNRLEGKVARV